MPVEENAEDLVMTTFTHLRVTACTSPEAIEDVEVCLDPGISKSIIDIIFL